MSVFFVLFDNSILERDSGLLIIASALYPSVSYLLNNIWSLKSVPFNCLVILNAKIIMTRCKYFYQQQPAKVFKNVDKSEVIKMKLIVSIFIQNAVNTNKIFHSKQNVSLIKEIRRFSLKINVPNYFSVRAATRGGAVDVSALGAIPKKVQKSPTCGSNF